MGIDPVTLTIISAGLSAFQGIQGYQQGKAMAKQQGAITAANIQNEQNRLGVEKDQLKRQQEKVRGTQRTAAAASGATLGSFDDVMGESTENSLLDLALMEYDSKVNQESMRYEGAVRKSEYKSQAKSSLINGITSAASAGASGFGKAYPNGASWNGGDIIRWNGPCTGGLK